MHIISKSQMIKFENYSLCFEWKDMPGAGFSFPCDKDGAILLEKMPPLGQENLQKCLSGEYEVTAQGVKDYSHTYREPAQGRCECGRIVVLEDVMTNACECGREYNGGGQLLAPRSQWCDEWVTKPEEDYGYY